MAGAKDEIVVWDSFGKKRLRKYYLTMHLPEAYAFLYETKQVEMDCSFSAFCKLRPQNVLLIGHTPRDQCKSVTHEKFFLKLDAMGYTKEKTFWEEILRDVSENSQC